MSLKKKLQAVGEGEDKVSSEVISEVSDTICVIPVAYVEDVSNLKIKFELTDRGTPGEMREKIAGWGVKYVKVGCVLPKKFVSIFLGFQQVFRRNGDWGLKLPECVLHEQDKL